MLSSFWGSERAWIGDQELGSRKGTLQRQTKPGPFVPLDSVKTLKKGSAWLALCSGHVFLVWRDSLSCRC